MTFYDIVGGWNGYFKTTLTKYWVAFVKSYVTYTLDVMCV